MRIKTTELSWRFLGTDVKLSGLAGDHITKSIEKSNGFYEQEMLEEIAALQPNATVVDVGANIGNHSVFFALFTSAARVVALEPYEVAFNLLESNLAANQLDCKVKALRCAVGADKGRCGLKVGRGNIGHTVVKEGEEIAVETLDEILKAEEVSVIKIDVEGFEGEVLKGARKLLREQNPDLFIEVRKKRKPMVDTFLAGFGYYPRAVFNNVPTYLYSR
jgi:protein O-GlcNAc transferase